MISSKSRKNATGANEGFSSAIPRPSDIARNLATSSTSSTVSSSSKNQSLAHSHNHSPAASSLFNFDKHRTPLPHNPYDDLSLYTTQINAANKSSPRSVDAPPTGRVYPSQGHFRTAGGYLGFNKPPDSTSGRYGYDKPSGYYGFNKPKATEFITPSDHFGYNKPKPKESSKDSAFYDYNRSVIEPAERPEYLEYAKRKSAEQAEHSQYNRQQSEPVRYRGNDRAKSVEPSGYYGFNKSTKGDGVPGERQFAGRTKISYAGQNIDRDIQKRPDYLAPHSRTGFSQQKIASDESCFSGTRESTSGKSRYEHSNSDKDWSHIMAKPATSRDDHANEYDSFPWNEIPLNTSTPKRSQDPRGRIDYGYSGEGHSTSESCERPLRMKCDITKRFNDRSQSLSPVSHYYQVGDGKLESFGNTQPDIKPTVYTRDHDQHYLDSPLDDRGFTDTPSHIRDYDNAPSAELKSHPLAQDSNSLGHYTHNKPQGLAATMNYHQQLRRELGMPQTQPPHFTYTQTPFRGQYSNIITPLPSSSDGSINISSARPMSPKEKNAADYLASVAQDRNAKRFHEAFQSLHGHYSTPHLPSAILTQFEQTLSGSDPNLQSESKQSDIYTYYDNLTSPRTRTKPSGTYPFEEPKIFVEQYSNVSPQNRSSKSSSSIPTLLAPPFNSGYPFSGNSSYGQSPYSVPYSSSAATASMQHSYYSSPSVQGLCTLPRTKSPSPCPATNSIYSLQKREPSYEEIENITPHKTAKEVPASQIAHKNTLDTETCAKERTDSSGSYPYKATFPKECHGLPANLNHGAEKAPDNTNKPTSPGTSSQDDKSKFKTTAFKVKKGIFGSVSEKAHRFEQAAADVPVNKDKDRPKLKLKDVFGHSKSTRTDASHQVVDHKDNAKANTDECVVTSSSTTSVTPSPLATSSSLSAQSWSLPSRPSRMSNPEEDTKFSHDPTMTSSMHEASQVDVEAISHFLQSSCTYPYHVFSRRKKPLPELETSPEYARMISEVERSRSSQGSNDGSMTSLGSGQGKASVSPASPLTPSSQGGSDSDDFVNKVCKFEMISRGKTSSTPSKSPASKSLTVKTPTPKSLTYDGKLASPPPLFGTLPGAFVGEKVFTRDTATTRVSASLLQGLGKERVSSTVSTNSSNSLTSVSTLSWTSDASDSFAGSSKGLNNTGSTVVQSNFSPEVMTTSDPGVFQTKTSPSGVTSSATFHDFDHGTSPTAGPHAKEAYIFTSTPTSSSGKRGGIIDLSTGTGTTTTPSAASNSKFPQQQHHQPQGTTKKFVTLSASRDYTLPPVVKPLSPLSSFPFITVDSPFTPDNRPPRDSDSPVVVNGETTNSPSTGNHDKTLREIEEAIRASSHRNTYEGMDFNFSDLTAEQKELALKHKEVVAERKMEQEREKKDRQRLDEILKMCEEYQNEINVEICSTPTHLQGKASFGFSPTQQQPKQSLESNSRRNESPGLIESAREKATSPNSSLENRDWSGSMTKIKTNGSLILNSPNNVHKEFGHFGFQDASSSAAKAESTASLAYSSNSEDEAVGSSEDTGTIKKRPHTEENPISPLAHSKLQPKYQLQKQLSNSPKSSPAPHLTIGHNAITMTADISDDNVIITTTNNFTESVTITLPDQSHSGINSSPPMSSPKLSPSAFDVFQNQKPRHFKDVPHLDQFSKGNSPSVSPKSLENGYKKELHDLKHADGSTKFDYSMEINAQYPPISSTGVTCSYENNQEKLQSLQFSEKIRNSQSSNGSPPSSNFSSKRESKDSLVRESHSSTSSSQTLRDNSTHSSRTSSFSSNVAMDTKEDTPTPVNSDSEQGEADSIRAGQLSLQLSTTTGVETPLRSSVGSLSPREECQLRGQLEGLKLTKTQLLVRIAEIKRQIAEIELQESEAVRELDLETKLLEGEHREQMAYLQREQDRISEMKRRQQETLDLAMRERENEQRIIELERQKLLALEEQLHQLNARLLRASTSSTSSSGSVGSSSLVMHDDVAAMRVRLLQELERQRRIFDDLEFQQLEAEARFETEKEQITNRLMAQQAELLQKYKEREERLQQIDIHQKQMLGSVKSSLEDSKEQRSQLSDSCKKEKSKVAHCDKKIVEIARVLSIPVPDDNVASDDESEDSLEAQSPFHHRSHHRFIDSTGTPIELRRPFDFSLDSPSSSGSGGIGGETDRKKSATMLEIERNRSLFIEQQGSLIIDQERKRIEELRRRAADEGRAQWEERRRAADENSRLQIEDRRLREANCKSFNSLESEDSSITSSCDTPSEKETR